MATEKPSLHLTEDARSSPPDSHHELNAEEIKGRDFTVDQDALPPGYFTSFNFLGSMFAMGASLGAGVASFAMIAPVLSYVNADIGPSPNLTWVALAYLLTTSVGFLIVGRVTDIFGRRWTFIGGSVLATVGSIVCATAPNVNALIAGETLLGLASSSQLSYVFAVSELVPIKWRFLGQGYVCIWGIPGSGLAPVIAYSFVFKTNVGWRGVFYLLIALNALITVAWVLCYHPPDFKMKHGNARKWQYIKEFDYIGLLMVVLGMLLFLMGISWGGVLYPWKSAHVISTIVVGFALLVAFVLYEIYMPLKEPVVPMYLFKNRGWNVTVIIWALGASVYYSLALLYPNMVAVLYSNNHGIMWVGWASCVSNSAILFGEYFVPLGMMFPKRTMQIWGTFTIGAIFVAAAAACGPNTPVMAMVLIFIGAAFTGYCEVGCCSVSTIVIDDQREIGTATGLAASIRTAVSTVCSTVYTTVLANRLATTIPNRVPSALTSAGLPSGSVTAFLGAVSTGSASAWEAVEGLTPEIREAGMNAYRLANSDAYRTVFLTTIAFSGLGIICGAFYPNMDHKVTSEVSVQIQQKAEKSEA
ncbi:MFS general substrate transporter [Trichodelitschia bisporula]|uniref:MFS general substrate transporter n=1 Tax=Trichodelitschia bisporula TaxID=703511 RepID=A0A6G1HLH5_9PEZI|nr:MFS general substrate transporter [Trichodelitschia bisporula]